MLKMSLGKTNGKCVNVNKTRAEFGKHYWENTCVFTWFFGFGFGFGFGLWYLQLMANGDPHKSIKTWKRKKEAEEKVEIIKLQLCANNSKSGDSEKVNYMTIKCRNRVGSSPVQLSLVWHLGEQVT